MLVWAITFKPLKNGWTRCENDCNFKMVKCNMFVKSTELRVNVATSTTSWLLNFHFNPNVQTGQTTTRLSLSRYFRIWPYVNDFDMNWGTKHSCCLVLEWQSQHVLYIGKSNCDIRKKQLEGVLYNWCGLSWSETTESFIVWLWLHIVWSRPVLHVKCLESALLWFDAI